MDATKGQPTGNSFYGFRRCAVCNEIKPPKDLKQCSRCKHPEYLVCSRECQVADWKEHKKICGKTLPMKYQDLRFPIPRQMSQQQPRIVPVMDPGDPLAFVYTSGFLHLKGRPELLAVDVPANKVQAVSRLLIWLAEASAFRGKCFHGYKGGVDGYSATTLHPQNERQRKALIKRMGLCDLTARVCLVKPSFDEWQELASPPKSKTIQVETILGKWRSYRMHHDPSGDTSIALERILQNFDESDEWQMATFPFKLTTKEIKLVSKHKDVILKLALAELCLPDMAKADAYVEQVAKDIHLAPQRYKRGMKVAPGNYTWEF